MPTSRPALRPSSPPDPEPRRRHTGLAILAVLGLAIMALIFLWDWNWFKPLVESRASAALQRPVHIGHLDLRLAWHPTVMLEGITIDNPADFPGSAAAAPATAPRTSTSTSGATSPNPESAAANTSPAPSSSAGTPPAASSSGAAATDSPTSAPAAIPFARIDSLTLQINPWALLHRQVLLPFIDIDHPQLSLLAPAGVTPNWVLNRSPVTADNTSRTTPAAPPWSVDIGLLTIEDGSAQVLDEALKSDFNIQLHTEQGVDALHSRLIASADGRYAGQPITAHFNGGALLSLRDPQTPYPLGLDLQNGSTRLSLQGTLRNPLQFAGADLDLHLGGSDMALLYPLTSVPFPHTAPYELRGKLDYLAASRAIRFADFHGQVGSSDLNGTIAVEPFQARRLIEADLNSRHVDLADLAGFLGSTTPGKDNVPGRTSTQKAAKAKADASSRLLPDTPINLPRLREADVDLRYQALRIDNQTVPLDKLAFHLILRDGVIDVDPLNFGVGGGTIASHIHLDGSDNTVHVKADTDFRELDFGHIVNKTSAFRGAGKIGGKASFDGHGQSLAQMAASGDGGLTLSMQGGDISALLVDLAGFDFGNGVLSAIGVPSRAPLRCMVTDFGLRDGLLDTHLMLFDTTEANIVGTGSLNLKNESIDYQLRTEPKHFNIGSLRTPIDISGPLKDPSIRPDPTGLAVRGGAAVLLGIFATPLAAILPTIQLGLGKDNDCNALMDQAEGEARTLQQTSGTTAPKRSTGTPGHTLSTPADAH